jgi:hypothetical protein
MARTTPLPDHCVDPIGGSSRNSPAAAGRGELRPRGGVVPGAAPGDHGFVVEDVVKLGGHRAMVSEGFFSLTSALG